MFVFSSLDPFKFQLIIQRAPANSDYRFYQYKMQPDMLKDNGIPKLSIRDRTTYNLSYRIKITISKATAVHITNYSPTYHYS